MVSKSISKDKNDSQVLDNPDKTIVANDELLGKTKNNSESVDVTATSPAKSDNGGRKRKRHLFNSIRAQMEFYFGDANLSKDRFLRRYVEQDPFVPLDIFLTFNKIKTLTQDVQQISRSLSNSQLLELDESGLKVRRKTALPAQRDVNDKTLYVEALPRTASHDWLKEVFSRYGAVAYVSLPHYPGTRKIKEFAFIEFEKSASVEKALKAFAQVQGVLSVEQTDPADLASIRSFQQQQKLGEGQEQAVALKREGDKLEEEEAVTAPPECKRIKLETTQEHEVSAKETSDAQPTDTDDDKDEEGQSKHKRRRKQKKKLVVLDKHTPNIEPSALELKILPKSSWCSLRNKYLNLQRRIISEAKSKLWRNSQAEQLQSSNNKGANANQLQLQQQLLEAKESHKHKAHDEGTQPDQVDQVPSLPPKRRKRNKNIHKINMNFYGAGGTEADEAKSSIKAEDAEQERSPLFKYEPGLIVCCSLHESCSNVKDFKADMRQYPSIKYVDIKEGDQIAHLRMDTPTAAVDLIRQLNCAEMQLQLLQGQAETQYWCKIEQDREAKLTKKVRVQQKRGREKVAKLLAKHIKFDDADDEVAPAVATPSGPSAPSGLSAPTEPTAGSSIMSIPADV